MAKFHEHISRSFVKSMTFRTVVIIADFVVIFAITRHYGITLAVVVATNVASTILYFLHERIWNKIYWGKSARK